MPDLLQIRPMTFADIDGVLQVQAATYAEHYHEPATVFASKLALAGPFCFVAVKQQQLCGYLFAHPWPHSAPPALFAAIDQLPADADSLFIHDMALHPSCRGQAIGQHLLQHSLHAARQAQLSYSTLVAVQGAQRFWQRLGYRVAVIEHDSGFPGRYGEAAHYMQLLLGKTP